jgi:hypothetical protein
MILGLSFALVCALGTTLSSLFKARGAVLARPIQVSRPLRLGLAIEVIAIDRYLYNPLTRPAFARWFRDCGAGARHCPRIAGRPRTVQ